MQTPVIPRNGHPGVRGLRGRWAIAAVVVVLLAAGCHSGASAGSGPQTRAYYIAADEVAWNYAPAGTNMITGQPFDETANKYVQTGPDRIGSTYTKCLYHGYTDATFTHQIPRPADEQYLGLLGPVIRAQVGDTITVTFRNNCPFLRASIHTASSTTKRTRAPPTTTAGPRRTRPVTPWPRTSSTSIPGRYPSVPARARWTAAR